MLLPYVLALLAVGYLVTPFVWLVGASFMSEKEVTAGRWFPRKPVLSNYRTYAAATTSKDVGDATARSFLPALRNSIGVAVFVTLFNLVLGSLAAYGLARINTRGNMVLLLFYLISRSVPAVATMVPTYLLMQQFGLLDSPLSIILAHIAFTLPFTVWMLKGYFQTVPVDLEKAARVDGCSRLKSLVRVFLPITAPGLVAAGIFAFIFSWGEFLYALLFSTTLASKTIPVVASEFVAEIDIPFPLVAAGGVIAVLLPVVLAFLFQRFIVRGIGGAVTG